MEKNPQVLNPPGISTRDMEGMLENWGLPKGHGIVGIMCPTYVESDPLVWKKEIVDRYLHEQERENYGKMEGKKTQAPWLAGRVAAKVAIQRLVEGSTGGETDPRAITIHNDSHGKPSAQGEWGSAFSFHPLLSISHVQEFAVAVAGVKERFRGLGVDVGQVMEMGEHFIREAFHGSEIELLGCVEAEHRAEWVIRFWCGKEAAGKAAGRGLWHGPKSLRITDADWKSGTINLVTEGRLEEEVGRFSLSAFTQREGDFMFCLCCLETE